MRRGWRCAGYGDYDPQMLSDSSGKHSFLFLIKETGRLGKEFNVSLNMS